MGRGRQAGVTGRFGIAVVRGRSMEPGLRDGDRVLVRYDVPVGPGDVVVARFVDGTLVVKRVDGARQTRSGDPGWWLLSDNPGEGIDSRHRGVVPAEAVLGVVRRRVWPILRR
ncbi:MULTISPECIES: S24 family peptidase [unclassified Nocardioides]|uniref:S24 family peptidase n=1 Tax=unclassified Nocardioides TaxID=2615069 RepID=UPI0006FA1838|nr:MULTISPECIES: S24 family peptidase [unclassified Nocardioides]KQY54480.1 peptidase S24 [Nocardioides sp. Root140]KQZ66356.1 peptidase S24 [Nocardioides sp. Root151]KRF19556.1 peptidase S24 [Nocardioides sp. Soil796]